MLSRSFRRFCATTSDAATKAATSAASIAAAATSTSSKAKQTQQEEEGENNNEKEETTKVEKPKEDDVEYSSSSSSSSSTNKIVLDKPPPSEEPYLMEVQFDDGARKPFINPEQLRSFMAAFFVGGSCVGAVYWLMSHKITHEAMHRRRFIQSMMHEVDEDADGVLRSAMKTDPFAPFVAPSATKYRELVEYHREADRRDNNNNQHQHDDDSASGGRSSSSTTSGGAGASTSPTVKVAGGTDSRGGVLKEAYHSSLLHETAADRLKGVWNSCIDEIQESMRAAMGAWVSMREEDTILAVKEMARSHFGDDAEVEKVRENL